MKPTRYAIPCLAVLAACATAPTTQMSISEARSAVDQLAAQPDATQTAGKPLQDARDILAQAEAAAAHHKSNDEISHLAYLAKRQADLGEATLVEAHAHQQVAKAEADRNRILLEARDREVAAANQRAQEAQQQLQQMQAKQTDRGMVMTLGDVLFDTGKDTLKPGAELNIDRLAKYLESSPGTKIIVEGHTDNRGSDEYNEDLSNRRAQSVAKALESRGISADRIQAIGRGKSYPVASNSDAAGRQQNRRVEIVFSNPQGQFQQGANQSAASGG
jgi:OmpA-OmpF porin, OOP family